MQDEVIFVHPMRRRWWLLSKALENAPLDDALKIAQAVDQFLMSGEFRPGDYQIPDLRPLNAATAAPEAPPRAPSEGEPTAPSLDGAVDAGVEDDPVETPDETANGACPARHAAHGDRPLAANGADKAEWANGKSAGINNASPNGESDLAVWASIDDVVRYLRQRDDVVVPNGDGQFLVNGRFSEDINGLITRANRVRERQRKPPFQLMPAGFAAS